MSQLVLIERRHTVRGIAALAASSTDDVCDSSISRRRKQMNGRARARLGKMCGLLGPGSEASSSWISPI